METVMPNQFFIARWNDETETWKILEQFNTYDEADDRLDYWVDKYPSAWVDILDPSIWLVNTTESGIL